MGAIKPDEDSLAKIISRISNKELDLLDKVVDYYDIDSIQLEKLKKAHYLAAKNYKLVKDAEKIFYNLDGCRYEDEVILVEGEIDVLSFMELGLNSVLSVPNGFNSKGNIQLDYLDNCIEYFQNKKKIYLAFDNDEAGIKGRQEFIRRLGAERCYIVDFKDCKDANEYLVKYGDIALGKTITTASQVPLDGVSGVNDIDDFEDYLLNGMKGGYKIGKPHLDDIFSTYTGQYIVVTGEPSSGKSDFVDEMAIGYNKLYGWKTAYASKENKPNKIHGGKLIAKITGSWVNKQDQIDSSWYSEAKNHIHDNYKFIDLKESYDLKNVLDKAAELVMRHGIKLLVIDPYNKIRLRESLSKGVNDYTNDYFNMIDEFCTKYDVLVIVVMHSVKVLPVNGVKPEITAYHIKGGGEVFDMSPHILLVDRDYDYESVFIKVLKVKFHHLGENKAKRYFKWNPNCGRYSQFTGIVKEAADCDLWTPSHDNFNPFTKEETQLAPNTNFDEMPF